MSKNDRCEDLASASVLAETQGVPDEVEAQGQPLFDWSDDDFEPADASMDAICMGTRKYVAADKMEESLDKVREDALREAISAVNRTAAPIVGTPYSAGGRRFAEAIELLLKKPRSAATPPAPAKARETRVLPQGQVWAGFDQHGICQEASISWNGDNICRERGLEPRLCTGHGDVPMLGRPLAEFSFVEAVA